MKQVLFIDFIKLFIVSIGTIYLDFKMINKVQKYKRNMIKILFCVITINVISLTIKYVTNYATSIIGLGIFLALIFSIYSSYKMGYSILLNIFTLTLSNIICMLAIIIHYVLITFSRNENEIISIVMISIIYFLLLFMFTKIKKIKYGINFLIVNKNNEFFEVLILNISATIFLCFIIVSDLEFEIARSLIIYMIIFSIIMIVTIQKSLQLYYKQKMLIKDLEETKAELENKRKEVEELEKENLNFSKVSHSIAHKQKSLEFKLNELSMNSEISFEISLKDRVDKLGKELAKETISVIEKTGIEEIDDMLKYMQAECIKNKIDFQLQLSGNIYTMINHYIDKEELEILLADHIKNAIIAISYTDNLNKSILVRLGKLDGYYGLYIYDSGIEFEVKTLYKLGKIPATTHKDNGGTGMGFMNTFDTLRKHKASFVIEEYGKPVKNNFTKALKFIFNEKNEFKIYSYRWEKIRRENKEDNFVVEKLNI